MADPTVTDPDEDELEARSALWDALQELVPDAPDFTGGRNSRFVLALQRFVDFRIAKAKES
jgi:hypothetical protein